MELTEQHERLLRVLRSQLDPTRKFTIGVDGRDGAGKTNLARYLAWMLDISLIESDLVLIQGAEPPAYRYDDLARLIDSRHSLDWPVIVEGVFLMHTLKRVGVSCDFLIRVECEQFEGTGKLRSKFDVYETDFEARQKANYVFRWKLDR